MPVSGHGEIPGRSLKHEKREVLDKRRGRLATLRKGRISMWRRMRAGAGTRRLIGAGSYWSVGQVGCYASGLTGQMWQTTRGDLRPFFFFFFFFFFFLLLLNTEGIVVLVVLTGVGEGRARWIRKQLGIGKGVVKRKKKGRMLQ